jgi:hypothetical protein
MRTFLNYVALIIYLTTSLIKDLRDSHKIQKLIF